MTEIQVKTLRKATEDKALADLAKARTTWPRIWLLIDLATCSGLRVFEMANLKISDIEFNGKDATLSVIGKGKKKRTVEINSNLVRHIKHYIKSNDLSPDSYLLTSSHDKPYTTRALQKHFKSACKVSGLPEYYSIHSTRHSYATMLYASKKNLREVQKQLGHQKPSTTAIYADVLKEEISSDVNNCFNRL